jgi:hypothetical protein
MSDDLDAAEQTQNSDGDKDETYDNSLESPITSVGLADFGLHRSAIVAEKKVMGQLAVIAYTQNPLPRITSQTKEIAVIRRTHFSEPIFLLLEMKKPRR